jgi:hypothetical protein
MASAVAETVAASAPAHAGLFDAVPLPAAPAPIAEPEAEPEPEPADAAAEAAADAGADAEARRDAS